MLAQSPCTTGTIPTCVVPIQEPSHVPTVKPVDNKRKRARAQETSRQQSGSSEGPFSISTDPPPHDASVTHQLSKERRLDRGILAHGHATMTFLHEAISFTITGSFTN